jgi:hypothetical protein
MDTALNMSVFIIYMYITFVVRHLDRYYKWTNSCKCITAQKTFKQIIMFFDSLMYVLVCVYYDDNLYTLCRLLIVIYDCFHIFFVKI